MKIVNIVGARPNFMKIAPIMAAYQNYDTFESILVHTGQHYDDEMSELFFRQLGLPKPHINLEVGSGSHAMQTAEIMKAFEGVVIKDQPDAVLVVGDVNSTIACGLVAVKMGIKLVHVEAGLRSRDRSMPEEINRILTDSISDLLFCTEQSGVDNLLREGIPAERIFLVGNVMIDTLMNHKDLSERSEILTTLGLKGEKYAVMTLHRPANVDDAEVFACIVEALDVIQQDMPIVFAVHPRTRKSMKKLAVGKRLEQMKRVILIEPLGYLDFLRLMSSARVVLTDSGGIQEETTILRIPCLTLRENTERPITVEIGFNQVVGTNTERIVDAYRKAISKNGLTNQIPPLWDGQAAQRIVQIMARELPRLLRKT